MKIYLAHNYKARPWLNEVIRPQLESHGHIITSRWLIDNHIGRSEKEQLDYALTDLEDIDKADILIHFTDQVGWTAGRGKFIEVGYAYAMHKDIYVCGTDCDASVFYYLPTVTRFNTFDRLLEEKLNDLKRH